MTSTREDQKSGNEVGLIFQHVARQRMRLLDEALAPHGLSSAQVLLLNRLLRRDGLSQIELARQMGIGTVGVSGMVDRLEAADWVERRPDPKDRRAKCVFLKPSAMRKKKVLADAAQMVNAVSFKGLSDDEVSTLLRLMRHLNANLSAALGKNDKRSVKDAAE